MDLSDPSDPAMWQVKSNTISEETLLCDKSDSTSTEEKQNVKQVGKAPALASAGARGRSCGDNSCGEDFDVIHHKEHLAEGDHQLAAAVAAGRSPSTANDKDLPSPGYNNHQLPENFTLFGSDDKSSHLLADIDPLTFRSFGDSDEPQPQPAVDAVRSLEAVEEGEISVDETTQPPPLGVGPIPSGSQGTEQEHQPTRPADNTTFSANHHENNQVQEGPMVATTDGTSNTQQQPEVEVLDDARVEESVEVTTQPSPPAVVDPSDAAGPTPSGNEGTEQQQQPTDPADNDTSVLLPTDIVRGTTAVNPEEETPPNLGGIPPLVGRNGSGAAMATPPPPPPPAAASATPSPPPPPFRSHLTPIDVKQLGTNKIKLDDDMREVIKELQKLCVDDESQGNTSIPLDVCVDTLFGGQASDAMKGYFKQFMESLRLTLFTEVAACPRNFLEECTHMQRSRSDSTQAPTLLLTVRKLLNTTINRIELGLLLRVASETLSNCLALYTTDAVDAQILPFSSNLCRMLALQGKLVHVLYFVVIILGALETKATE